MKLVKCEVKNPISQKIQVRYIPLSEFELWEHLLKERHKIEVLNKRTMIWVDTKEYENNKGIYSRFFQEGVTKITLYLASKEDEMFIPVIRFLPKDNYQQLKSILLSHYQGQEIENIIEEDGHYINAEDRLVKAGRK